MSAHRSKPTVPEVMPLVRALYATPDGAAGCCLHGNLDDSSVRVSLECARREGHADCERLANLILLMSRTQRRKLYTNARLP